MSMVGVAQIFIRLRLLRLWWWRRRRRPLHHTLALFSDDILKDVLLFLSRKDLVSIQLTCSRLNRLSAISPSVHIIERLSLITLRKYLLSRVILYWLDQLGLFYMLRSFIFHPRLCLRRLYFYYHKGVFPRNGITRSVINYNLPTERQLCLNIPANPHYIRFGVVFIKGEPDKQTRSFLIQSKESFKGTILRFSIIGPYAYDAHMEGMTMVEQMQHAPDTVEFILSIFNDCRGISLRGKYQPPRILQHPSILQCCRVEVTDFKYFRLQDPHQPLNAVSASDIIKWINHPVSKTPLRYLYIVDMCLWEDMPILLDHIKNAFLSSPHNSSRFVIGVQCLRSYDDLLFTPLTNEVGEVLEMRISDRRGHLWPDPLYWLIRKGPEGFSKEELHAIDLPTTDNDKEEKRYLKTLKNYVESGKWREKILKTTYNYIA